MISYDYYESSRTGSLRLGGNRSLDRASRSSGASTSVEIHAVAKTPCLESIDVCVSSTRVEEGRESVVSARTSGRPTLDPHRRGLPTLLEEVEERGRDGGLVGRRVERPQHVLAHRAQLVLAVPARVVFRVASYVL